MKEPLIRRGVLPDLPYLYEICLKTTDSGKDGTHLYYDPYMIGQYYAAPYLFYKEGICFVAEYEYRPQGYIVAVPDSMAYDAWMEEVWLKLLREHYPRPFPEEFVRSEDERRTLERIHKTTNPKDREAIPWYKDYPAHLHIDLLPGIQGKGMGRSLVEALFSELSVLGVSGLHLGVGKRNQGACAFYRKTGFSELAETETGYTMGRKVEKAL
jgi:GNAT superfamily N-acetyltransferase